jgi:hypothetical protein
MMISLLCSRNWKQRKHLGIQIGQIRRLQKLEHNGKAMDLLPAADHV